MNRPRIISLLLCLILFVSILPLQAAAKSGDPAFGAALSADDVSFTDGRVSVSLSNMDGTAKIAAAFYDRNGRMVGSDMKTPAANTTQDTLTARLSGVAETVQVFLLGSSFVPLCEPLQWTYDPIDELALPEVWKQELRQARDLGLPMEQIGRETVSGEELTALLDRLVEYAAPDQLTQWQTMLPALREHEGALTRFDAMGALFLTAQFLGEGWAAYKSDFTVISQTLQFPWDRYYFTEGLYAEQDKPIYSVPGGDGHYLDSASLYFNLSRPSPYSGEFPFAYDADANSIHDDCDPTYAECVLAVIRLIASEQPELFGTLPADKADETILTPALIEKAQALPEVTADHHPRWTGFVLGWDEDVYFSATPENIAHVANWGFNSVRIIVDYANLFDPADVTKGNPANLRTLDRLVAAAIENGIHLDLCLCKMPGREARFDPDTYTSTGSFDLFINEDRQKEALSIWTDLATRYREIPSASLTFTPIYETQNYDLSTGLEYEPYTAADVGAYLVKAIDTIRAQDPDRLIIYEPTGIAPYQYPNDWIAPVQEAVKEKSNILISYNSGEEPYNYAAMTATEGEHIDNNNHSIPLPDYPTCFYAANNQIWQDAPMTLTGFLPAETRLDLYLDSSASGTITVTADEAVLHQETVEETDYAVSYSLSRFYPYATSDKKISVVLTETTDALTISTDQWFIWSGMDVILPEEYAVDQWWYITPYDVFLGLEEQDGIIQKHTSRIIISPTDDEGSSTITIHDNVSYTTEKIHRESNRETIQQFCENVSKLDGNCILRTEPEFVGVVWEDWAAYLHDIYSAFTAYGFSWWSNEFWAITNEYPQTKIFAGNTIVSYDGFEHFNLELLQLLQNYQSKD